MQNYDELKAEEKLFEALIVAVKKCERAKTLKEVKGLCKEFGFAVKILKGIPVEDGKKK